MACRARIPASALSSTRTKASCPAHAIWFGEDQGRYVVEVTPQKAEEILERARLLELPARIIGRTGGDAIGLKGETALPLSELRAAHEAWMPKLMGA